MCQRYDFHRFVSMDMHKQYMHRCLELAQMGAGSVSPNPMVGAVIVLDGKIIGEDILLHMVDHTLRSMRYSRLYKSMGRSKTAYRGKYFLC